MESSPLPVAGLMSAWLGACLAGAESPDAMLSALGEETHLVAGVEEEPLPLLLALGALRRSGGTGASLALPAPGDPVGLAGPADFNAAALEAGAAVLITGAGLGLVPAEQRYGVLWSAAPATAPPPLDPGPAGVNLREALVTATARLVELDVARWQPEVADVLSNLAHRPANRLPRLGPRLLDTVDRAVLCLEVVGLALAGDGAAITAAESAARRDALTPLDRAARHALVAALSR